MFIALFFSLFSSYFYAFKRVEPISIASIFNNIFFYVQCLVLSSSWYCRFSSLANTVLSTLNSVSVWFMNMTTVTVTTPTKRSLMSIQNIYIFIHRNSLNEQFYVYICRRLCSSFILFKLHPVPSIHLSICDGYFRCCCFELKLPTSYFLHKFRSEERKSQNLQ